MFNTSSYSDDVAFGGDTFINKFAYKTKLPFFLDNRVNGIDDSDIFYDEIGNIAYPKFWHSARSILYTYENLINIVSIKAHNFDCYNDPASIPKDTDPTGGTGTYRTFYDGYFYLFAYGIPSFYCESNYNVDLRQAFNIREGDFWPHVSTGIPDDWVQEEFTSIAYDNSYFYNVTFSKQNKENFFSHLPADWTSELCYTHYPFRVVYSDPQVSNVDVRVNNWLSYSPISLYDFPQNYGNLISLDGIQNKSILARFENKSLLYNNLLTMETSNPQAAYLGNPNIFSAVPIDFAETDLGFVGSQNKFLLKLPQGQITVDAKRGQVFLVQGTKVDEIAGFGSGVNRFMTDHLSFEISRYFPTHQETIDGKTITIPGVDTDNNFNGIGLHGVYDSKFERVIITKLDYIPIDKNVKYDPITKEFYVEKTVYVVLPTTTSTTTIYTPTTTTTSSSTSSTTSTTSSSTSSTTTTSTTLYPVVNICGVEWTSKNVDVVTYRDGAIIPQALDQSELAAYGASKIGCWSYVNFDPANGPIYGKLYNWWAVAGVWNTASRLTPSLRKQFAPIGYSVPSGAQWQIAIDCLDGSSLAGGHMKQVGTSLWVSPNPADNSSGFTALPGGLNITSGTVTHPPSNIGYNSYFWNSNFSTSSGIDYGGRTFFRNTDTTANLSTQEAGNGLSVRLIKN
jgi:uncharacterized protein (TIGR02145 family)